MAWSRHGSGPSGGGPSGGGASGDGSGSGPGRERYHHGNLREALIAAALELIPMTGPAGFSFAELARAAGVSPAAPYRHFRDRSAVIVEIARRGFERFADELAAAGESAPADPVAAMLACGSAYLSFARANPAYYAAMFQSGGRAPEDAALAEAGDRAFAVLRRGAERLCAASTLPHRPPPLMVALHIWALAHGVASLFLAGGSGSLMLPGSPEDLLEAGTRLYLQSLAIE